MKKNLSAMLTSIIGFLFLLSILLIILATAPSKIAGQENIPGYKYYDRTHGWMCLCPEDYDPNCSCIIPPQI